MAKVNLAKFAVGDRFETVVEATGPASYATGGETVTAKQLGLSSLHHASVSSSDNGAYLLFPVSKSSAGLGAVSIKIMWMVQATGAETASTTDLSARKYTIRAIGFGG